MDRRKDERDDVTAIIHAYIQRKSLRSAFIFGSLATATQTRRSDVDLVFIYDTDKKFLDRYADFEDLPSLFSRPVDLLPYTPQEWADVSMRPFYRKRIEQGEVIHVGQ